MTRYLYEPYGEQIRSWVDPNAGTSSNDGAESAALTAPTTDDNPWRYASGYYDTTTKLLKFGTRYYAPQLSRWIQRDPNNGVVSRPVTLNAYLYASADAVNRTDRTGRWDECDTAEAVGVLSGGIFGGAVGFLAGGPPGAAAGAGVGGGTFGGYTADACESDSSTTTGLLWDGFVGAGEGLIIFGVGAATLGFWVAS